MILSRMTGLHLMLSKDSAAIMVLVLPCYHIYIMYIVIILQIYGKTI